MFDMAILDNALLAYKKVFLDFQWEKEKYKWEAVKHFQDHWDIDAPDFSAMFMEATRKTDNLLASKNNYPRQMLKEFSDIDPETVRIMFADLYNERLDLGSRTRKFEADANDFQAMHNAVKKKKHYQDANVISTYLWLRFPDKHIIYKYLDNRNTARILKNNFIPIKGKGHDNLLQIADMYEGIRQRLKTDPDLPGMLQSVLTADCYPDPELLTMAIDVGFYISRYYSKLIDTIEPTDEWYPVDYHPGLTLEQWQSLLRDSAVFTPESLKIMKRLKDIGGAATCTELSERYGNKASFYNMGSTQLARRVADKANVELMADKEGDDRYWPILYTGKKAQKGQSGVFIWRLRDELSEALDTMDLSAIPLHEKQGVEKRREEADAPVSYWWLNANPNIWSFYSLPVDGVQAYSLFSMSGNKRRVFQNFLDAKAGDLVIGYETTPVKKVVALAVVEKENDGQNLYFRKTEGLAFPLDYDALKAADELSGMEFFVNPNGSLFRMTKAEYDYVIEQVRESNPGLEKKSKDPYRREDFLKDVYLSGEKFDELAALLTHKKNIILQGAPGVGKTYAAIRLAYAMMGEKDDDRVVTIQFHQSYSYEDFIIGYKPSDKGFSLQNGVFYRFCQKAANAPDRKFFFIIDEINRGNLSKIFGELLMLVEKEYRNRRISLPYQGYSFLVPDNVYLIGMMNTAERSLALIDYALRRRFSIFDMEPGFESDGFTTYLENFQNDTFKRVINLIKELNAEIENDDALGSGFMIGHSYFCEQTNCSDAWLKQVIEYDILPMLREYWYDEKDKVQRWAAQLRGVFNG